MRPTGGMTEQGVIQRITSIALILGGAIAAAAVIGFPVGVGVISFPAQYPDTSSLGNLPLWACLRVAGVFAIVLGFSNLHHFIQYGAGAVGPASVSKG